jgi:hypothetical protein
MIRFFRVGAVLPLVLFLAGCAAKPAIPFDRASAPDIKTIGIVSPSMAPLPAAHLASNVGMHFGILGELVEMSMESDRQKKLAAILGQEQFNAESVFADRLAASLKARGYRVVMVPAKRDKAEFLESYTPGEGDKVDAYLDVVVAGYGYMAAGRADSEPWRPAVVSRCQLVGANGTPVLMQDRVSYNPLNGGRQEVSLSPDPNFAFTNFDDLTGAPAKAAQGLQVALGQTADAIASLLR